MLVCHTLCSRYRCSGRCGTRVLFCSVGKTEQEGGEIANVRSYLYMMVRNRSLDWLKQNSMFDTTLSPSDLEDRLPEEEVEERTVMEARIWTAIDSLPDRCREVFLLNKRDGMKYKDIADKFHISVHTVDNHIQKALRLIREGAYKVYTFFSAKISLLAIVNFSICTVLSMKLKIEEV